MSKTPAAIITRFRYCFAPPQYRILDVAECSSISFDTAQEAADYAAEHYAGQTVQWNLGCAK